jgi:hypothetical protein
MTALASEARTAPAGLLQLIRGGRSWDAAFQFSAASFVRSFAAPLAALPLYVLAVAVVDRSAAGLQEGGTGLWSAALAHLVDTLGFPLVLAALAGPLRFKGGYLAFVVVSNWATLYLNLLLLAAALLTVLGADGATVFSWLSLALLCLSVVLTWRIARETLSHEAAPIALVVVLDVAWGVLADEVSRRLIGA